MLPNALSRTLVLFHWLMLVSICAFLTLKSTLQFSRAFDFLMYHLPLALQSWNLTTFAPSTKIQNLYGSLPLFGEYFQGFLVLISGKMSSANLINIIGVIACIVAAKMLFKNQFSIRWFLTVCLAVPLVVIHATTGYIDLFTAELLLLTFIGMYGILGGKGWLAYAVFITGLFLAMGTRMQAWPLCFLFGGIAICHMLLRERSLHRVFFVLFIVAILTFFPLKNILTHGNPTYPVRTPLVANFISMPYLSKGGSLTNVPPFLHRQLPPVQFFASAFEINRLYSNTPYQWSYDQYAKIDDNHRRMGGWFFLTVIGMMILLVHAFISRRLPRSILSIFIGSILIVSCIPHMLELRYALFIPLIAAFLLSMVMQSSSIINTIFKGFFIFCSAIVLLNMPPKFWQIDSRPSSAFAPNAAKEFWEEQRGNSEEIDIQEHLEWAIYWSGPTFSEYKVRNSIK